MNGYKQNRHELKAGSLWWCEQTMGLPAVEDKTEAPCTHCQKPHTVRWGGMVSCDGCKAWYHHDCCAANALWRKKVEMVTSYLCLVCSHMESRGMLEVAAGEDGQPPVKKSRVMIEEEKMAKIDECFERHLAMTRRRGRKYDPNYNKPMKQDADK